MGKSISTINITRDLPVQGFNCMGRHAQDMLISSKAISYLKLFDKLCVRTQVFKNINFTDKGFSFPN